MLFGDCDLGENPALLTQRDLHSAHGNVLRVMQEPAAVGPRWFVASIIAEVLKTKLAELLPGLFDAKMVSRSRLYSRLSVQKELHGAQICH